MYVITRNNRKQFKGMAFETYEKARQFLRKHIRKIATDVYDRQDFGGNTAWDSISRNPVNFTRGGWHIEQRSS